MEKLTWTTEKRKVKELVPADYNPRTIGEKEKADLMASVVEFGKVVPIVVNGGKKKNNLIGGHQRVQIYMDLGQAEEEIDVRVPSRELTATEERELNIRLNKNTGSWDWDKITDNFEMDELMAWGFEDDDLKAWFGLTETDNTDVDEARLGILTVLPPEAPMLKEKVAIKFKAKEDYDAAKKFILEKPGEAAKVLLMAART
jgi:ParB-like chromosome segregation protein Spo0J